MAFAITSSSPLTEDPLIPSLLNTVEEVLRIGEECPTLGDIGPPSPEAPGSLGPQ